MSICRTPDASKYALLASFYIGIIPEEQWPQRQSLIHSFHWFSILEKHLPSNVELGYLVVVQEDSITMVCPVQFVDQPFERLHHKVWLGEMVAALAYSYRSDTGRRWSRHWSLEIFWRPIDLFHGIYPSCIRGFNGYKAGRSTKLLNVCRWSRIWCWQAIWWNLEIAWVCTLCVWTRDAASATEVLGDDGWLCSLTRQKISAT